VTARSIRAKAALTLAPLWGYRPTALTCIAPEKIE
jgi:hypothetical protein